MTAALLDPDTRPAHTRPILWLAVVAGALPGTLARYAWVRAVPARPGHWPTATFLTNLLGAFVLGALLIALARRGEDTGRRRLLRVLLGTGFCGAFTTYSTLATDTDLLVTAHRPALAVAYAAASVVAGGVASLAGILLAARLVPGVR